MVKSNDISDWLIRLKQKDDTPQLKKKTQIRSNVIIPQTQHYNVI